MQTHSELLSLVCVSCSVSFSRFSACPLGVCLASKLVYISTPPKDCQRLFATFFSFLAFFSVLRTHFHFWDAPRSEMSEHSTTAQRPSFRTKAACPQTDRSCFRRSGSRAAYGFAISSISIRVSSSRMNCSVLMAPSSQRSRLRASALTPSLVCWSALKLRICIAGASTST